MSSWYLINLYSLVQFKALGSVSASHCTGLEVGVRIPAENFLQGFDKSSLIVRRLVSLTTAASRVFNWRSRFVMKYIPGSIGLTVRVTKNNIFIVVYTMAGKNLFWLTRGRHGYKFNLYTAINVSLIRLMLGTTLDILKNKYTAVGPVIHCLTVRGRVPTKRILQDLRTARLLVRQVRISQPLPHNGCRLPHRRRGARN